MEKSFTPGPWKAEHNKAPFQDSHYQIEFGNDGECIAEIVHNEMDAKLIAAAPDLLKALEKIVDIEKESMQSDGNIVVSMTKIARESLSKFYDGKI